MLCTSVRSQDELEMIRQRLADLQSMEAALAELVNRCTASRGRVTCPLIASLQEASVDGGH